jgi:hypothetical protein
MVEVEMAKYQEFTIDQGSDVTIQLKLTEIDGQAKNLTNYSVAGKLKRTYNSDSDNTFDFQASIVDAAAGIVNLSLTNQQTDSMRPDTTYLFDVELSYDSGGTVTIERILEGRVTTNKSMTR